MIITFVSITLTIAASILLYLTVAKKIKKLTEIVDDKSAIISALQSHINFLEKNLIEDVSEASSLKPNNQDLKTSNDRKNLLLDFYYKNA
jgi:cell shape-determining protein MreC